MAKRLKNKIILAGGKAHGGARRVVALKEESGRDANRKSVIKEIAKRKGAGVGKHRGIGQIHVAQTGPRSPLDRELSGPGINGKERCGWRRVVIEGGRIGAGVGVKIRL